MGSDIKFIDHGNVFCSAVAFFLLGNMNNMFAGFFFFVFLFMFVLKLFGKYITYLLWVLFGDKFHGIAF